MGEKSLTKTAATLPLPLNKPWPSPVFMVRVMDRVRVRVGVRQVKSRETLNPEQRTLRGIQAHGQG